MTSTPVRPATPSGAGAPSPDTRWTPARVVGALVSALFLVLGSLLAVGGTAAIGVSAVLRDDDGLYRSDSTTWSTPGYAVRSTEVHLRGWPMMPAAPSRTMGTVEVTAAATTEHDVFVGIARATDVDRYLGAVARSTVEDLWDADSTGSRFIAGGAPALRPAESSIWVASASGPGSQTLTWAPRTGRWCLVVMNDDGSAPVVADVTLAAELPLVNTASAIVLVTGLVLLVAASLGLWLALPQRPPPADHRGAP